MQSYKSRAIRKLIARDARFVLTRREKPRYKKKMNSLYAPYITTIKHNPYRAIISRLLLGITPALVLMLAATPATHAGGARAATNRPLAGTIQVVSVFDYPAANSETFPERVNNRGDIAGTISEIGFGLRTRGFELLRNGTFTPPLSDPNATSSTLMWGINDARTACGFYFDPATHTSHGFFYSSAGVYTPFDVAGL